MRRALTAIFLIAMLSTWVRGQTEAIHQLKGTITDSVGAAIPDAYILIHWDSSGSAVGLPFNIGIKEDLVVRTDRQGSFSVNLPSGFYDVLVTADGFSPQCQKIRLRQVEENYHSVRLNLSALVSRELGTPAPAQR